MIYYAPEKTTLWQKILLFFIPGKWFYDPPYGNDEGVRIKSKQLFDKIYVVVVEPLKEVVE